MLPEELKKAIRRNAEAGPGEIALQRASFCKKWLSRAEELKVAEAEFKASLPDHISKILAPKRLLLWKEITCDLEYPDCQVFDEVTQGVQLTGCTPVTNLFPPTYKPSNRSLAGVDVSAESLRQRVLERAKPQGEEDTTVHSKTQEEREKGWIRGPIPVSDLSCDSLLSRRFGLKQGPKVRLIDDMSFGGVNNLVTVHESPKPHGPDVIASAALECMRCSPGTPLKGRAYDLRSAYRQLAIHPSSLKHAYILHWNPLTHQAEADRFKIRILFPSCCARHLVGRMHRVVPDVDGVLRRLCDVNVRARGSPH